jgi:hypothetical protein
MMLATLLLAALAPLVLARIWSEWSHRGNETCLDFAVRAEHPRWPAYRAAHVLQSPPSAGFTVHERAHLIAMGEAAANASGGWRADRHISYPTTDLNVDDDLPFAYARRVGALVREWVLPHIARLGGVAARDLRVRDLFLVKYEARADGSAQQALAPHEDGSTWTFSMGLNDASEYVGGGCRFLAHGVGTVHSSTTTVLSTTASCATRACGSRPGSATCSSASSTTRATATQCKSRFAPRKRAGRRSGAAKELLVQGLEGLRARVALPVAG